MRSKLFGRLMSFTLSATVALTSGIPALAYDGGGGDLPEDEEEIQLLEEDEEIGSDFDAPEEIVEDEEEFSAIEEDEAEFEFYEDARFKILDLATDSTVAAYTIAGDVASKISSETGDATIPFDSTKDFVFYVAPDMGYNWSSGQTPVTIEGGYTLDGTAYTVKANADYKIAASDISYATFGGSYDNVDWSLAKKVTIIGGTNTAKAIAGALTGTSAESITATLSEVTAAQEVQLYTVYKDGLTKPNVDLTHDDYRPDYDAAYNTPGNFDDLISTVDADKDIKVSVAYVGAETIEFDAGDFGWNLGTRTFTLAQSIVNDAYVMAKKGYKLTVTFSLADDEPIPSNTIMITPTSTDYVKFALVDKASKTAATPITTEGYERDNDEGRFAFFAYPDPTLDTTRRLIDVEYKVAEDYRVFKNTAVVMKVYKTGAGYVVYGDDNYGTDPYDNLENYTPYAEGEGAFLIPSGNTTKDVMLTAVTAEQVIIKNAYDEEAHGPMVHFTVGSDEKTIDDDTVTLAPGYGSSHNEAITGEDYTFYVTPASGYTVSNVVVDMYNKAGTSSTSYTVAKGNLKAGAFGEYTVPAITGRLVITVTAAAESATLKTVEKTVADGTSAADISLFRLSDHKEITTSAGVGFVEENASLIFKAMPAKGKAIKSISYAVAGSDEYTTLTGTDDGYGNKDYTISRVTDNITIKIESEVGFTAVNVGNPNAVVKVNGMTVEDGQAIGGFPIGNEGINVSVTAKNGTVKNVWYSWGRAAESSEANAKSNGYVLSTSGGTIAKNTLTNFANATYETYPFTDYELYIYPQTERAATNYTATITKKVYDGGVTTEKITALDLFAGGTEYSAVANSASYSDIRAYDFAFADLDVTFARNDYKPVAGSTYVNTTYSLAKTGDAAVAKFFAQYDATSNPTAPGFNRIVTTKVAGTDTITVKEVVDDYENSWLDKVTYTASIPVVVSPLNEVFDGGVEVVSTIDTSAHNQISAMDGVDKTVLRTYKSGAFEDTAELSLVPYFINPDTGKAEPRISGAIASTEIYYDDVSHRTSKIKSIVWTTDPVYSDTQTADARKFTLSATTGETTTISAVKNAGTIKATATITYMDGSKDVAEIDLTAVDKTFGYTAVAVVTAGGVTKVIPAGTQTVTLEKRSGGLNSATVKYRVFESLNASGFADALSGISTLASKAGTPVTEEIIDEYLASEANINVKEVTATFDGCVDQDDFVAVTASNSGNTYTFTAAKVVDAADACFAAAEVNGIPVTTPELDFKVVNTAATTTVTMKTVDSFSGDDDTNGVYEEFETPQLKTTAAILKNSHSNMASDKYGEMTGFVFDALTVGTTITLPTMSDFDATTVSPKRTLVAWNNGTTWFAPGATYAVASTATLNAVWAYKYDDITVFNDLKDAPIGATETIGSGLSIPLSLRYCEVDLDATLKSKEIFGSYSVKYSTEFTTAKSGFTVTKANEESTALTITGTTVTGGATNPSAVVNYKWVDGDAEYETTDIDVTSGSTIFTVVEADAYKLEMDPISVEEGQTKAFKAYYYLATKARKDALALNSGAIASVNADIKAGGEDNAEVYAVAAADSNIFITGLKAGTSATLVLSVVSAQNEKKEIEVPITVTATKRAIVVKAVDSASVDTDDIEILVANADQVVPVTFNYVFNGTVQDAGAIADWKIEALEYDDDFEGTKAFALNGSGKVIQTNFAVTNVSTTDVRATIPVREDTFGTGKVKVSYVTGRSGETETEIFSAWFDVNTYYALTFTAQTAAVSPDIYYVYNDGVKVKNSTAGDITEKIVYSGASSYTVANAAKYTAEYPTGTDANDAPAKKFLGWSEGAASLTATDAEYAAGEAIVFKPVTTELTEWPFTPADPVVELGAQFGVNPITSIEGLPTVIRLTDENAGTGTDIDASANDLTDYESYQITQNPQDTAATISVKADDIGLFTIMDKKTPDRAVVKATADALWGTDGDAGRTVTMTAVGKVSKIGDFTIAKVAGKVGASAIHVTSGDLKYDIPVYLNGEFLDATVTPNVFRYMEDGVILEEGSKVVEGKTHYYKGGELVLNEIITVTVNGVKKLIMVEAGVQVTTPKNNTRAFNGKIYYIDADGYLGTGIITIDGKDYLFRPDGSKVFYTDSDVKDGKIDVDGTTYVIDKDTDEAEADHVHKWTATWAAWTVKDASTTVTLKCSVGGEEVTQTVGIVASEPNKAGIVTFTASITYAGETFTDVPKAAKKNGATEEIEEVLDISDGYGFYIDGLEEEYPYTGAAIKPSFAVIDASRGEYLAKGVDYTVSIKKNKKIGDVADVVVKGKGNYKDAAVTAHFTVVDPMKGVDQDDVELLKGAKIQFTTKSYVYTGKEILPTDIQLKLKGQSAFTTYEFNGTTYVDKEGNEIPGIWSVSNNVDKGTATLLLSGKTGSSAKATYKITAASFNETDFELTVDPTETEWAVKGAQPSVEVTWKGTPLIAGQDFKVTYDKANKAVGTATVKVSGKGNFTAKPALSKSFTVTALDLANAEIVASTAAAKVNAKSVKVTVLDANGDAIPAGKLAVTVYKDGSAVTGKLAADTEYTIVATPKNEKVTVLTGATPEFSVKIGTDIKKAKVAAKVKGYTVTYTGDPIIYDDDSFGEAFTVTIGGKTLTAGTDFVVAGHTNNIKKGTMTVTLQGIGDYCGTKPVKVKIVPKKLTR